MISRFTLRQLEYLVAVARVGSVARAAEVVNVSSPSVSAAITQLEAELGLPLFVRRRAQGLSLTPGGREISAQAERVLAEAGRLNTLAGDIAGQVRGPLAVGCLLTFAQIILPGLRRAFEARHADVHIRQFELHQLEIFERLRRAEIDVALSYDMDIPGDLQFRPLVTLEPYAMVAADHPLAGRSVVRVADLVEEPMILLDLPHSADYFLSFFRAGGVVPKITERTRDMAVMRSLVANGFGYGIANIRPLNDRAPDGKPLKFIPLESSVEPMRLGLILPKGAESLLTIRAFAEHALAYLSDGRVPGIATPQGAGG